MELTEKNILDLLKKGEETINDDNITHLTQLIDDGIGIIFGIELRGNEDGNDWWYQVEYFSEKIGKTIIWDYSFRVWFEGNEDFAKDMVELDKKIREFEESY